MKIIGGKFKGKKLVLPKDKKTRPLKSIVKESIFNLIQHSNKFNVKVENSYILDLFAGSGSFGLECISRDAKIVYFLENYSEALKVLKKNISYLKSSGRSKIIEEDCFDFFDSKKSLIYRFDIIFFDPPYKERRIYNLLKQIELAKIIEKGALIIFHRHKKDLDLVPESFKKIEERTYGISKIIFYILL